jgi:mannose PTS system EIIA component
LPPGARLWYARAAMIGLVIATHGQLAEELLRTASGIVGPQERCEALTITAGASMEEARDRLGQAIRKVDDGQGVLILTDMFGGTPSNLALTFLDDRIEVVTGVNLPMLLKLATGRADAPALRILAEQVTGYGQKNITLASELLRTRARSDRR